MKNQNHSPHAGTETGSYKEAHRENAKQSIDIGVGEVDDEAKTSGKYRATTRRERLMESSPEDTYTHRGGWSESLISETPIN